MLGVCATMEGFMSVTKRAFCCLVLIGLGWAVGSAQRSEPEFMLAIDAPAGETRIECVSGCELLGSRDLGNPNAGRMKVYTYGCSGAQRCEATVAGWLVQKKSVSTRWLRTFKTGRSYIVRP